MDKKKIAIIVLVFIFLGTMIFAFANPKDEELKGNSKPSEVDKDKITDDDKQDEEDKEKEGEIEKLEEENNNTNTVVNTNNGNNTDVVVDYYKLALEAVEKAEASLVQNDVDSAKDLINNVITDQKDDLLDRINDVQNIIDFDKLLKVLENKTNSSTNKNELNDARDFNTSNLVADKLNSLKDSASKTEFEERYNTVLLTLNDVTNPVINGVTEGEYTKRELEIEVVEDTEYVITLDGEAYELGTSIGEGVHVLKVVDKAFNEKVVNFTIDRTAPKLQPSYWKKTVEANKDVKEFTDLPEVKGIDELSDNVTVTLVNNTVNMAVPGEYKLQYVTEDQAGNKAYNDIFITVVDTTAPVITLNGESEITIEAGIDAYTELGAKVTDNVDATIENLQPTKINYSVNGEYVGEVDFVDIKKVGTYKVVYTYTDKAGNVGVDTTSKKHEYLIRVVNVVDTTSPVLALNGEENITVEAGLEYVDAGITATDNAEGKITESYTVYYSKDGSDGSWTGAENNEVNTKVVGSYNIWYEAKDESGNVSSIRRTVKVVDTTSPVLALNGEENITVEAGLEYVDAGITATDNAEGKITESYTVYYSKDGSDGSWKNAENNEVNTKIVGSYNIWYEAKDESGNVSSIRRTVKVVDTTSPVITLNGEENITVEAGLEYVDAGITATDNAEGKITESYTVYYSKDGSDGSWKNAENNEVNTKIVGSYNIWYEAKDESGNVSSIRRTVKVVDTTSPVITLNGEENITVEAGSEYVDAGITATDNAEGKITESYTVYYSKDGSDGLWTGAENNEVNTKIVGSYNIWYEAKDESGNVSSVRRTVKVVDTTSPVITLNGEENITVEAGSEYIDAGITATDNAEGKITESYTVYYSKDGSDGSWTGAENNEVNTKIVGSYNIWYEAKDESGNVSSVRRTVKVVDTTKPDPSVVEILTLEAFKGNTEYAKSGKTIRVYLTFKEELSSQRNGILGTYFGLFKVNGEELPLRKDSYNEETKEYNYIASYTIPEDANIEEGILPWSVEIFGDLAGNTIDPITKTVNARPGRTQIIYDNTIPGKVSTTYTPSDLTNQDVTVTIRVNEVITPVDGWTLSDDKMAISKTFSENIKGNVVVSDLAGNSEIRYYSVDNIDKESPVVDTLRVKGLKDGEGTTNFKKIKVGDTFQVILTTIEELGTLPVLVVDGKEITDVKVNKFDTYYQYIVSYKIPEDTTLIDGEQIAFVLKGYTDKAGNPGIELTNDNIKIGNEQTEVIFDKSAPTILIDRNITLHVGDNFVDDIREKIFDNVTSVENLYVGGGWGTFKDTSVAGNYHLNYKIMDEAGNYSVATRNITVIEP